MDISKFTIGRPVIIKTEDDIYESYISAITLSDNNFVYFKSGSLRNTLIDKLKLRDNQVGNKLDVSGGIIKGSLNIEGKLHTNGNELIPNIYSTTEDIVGTWLGKPLYRKVIVTTNFSYSAGREMSIGYAPNAETFATIRGFVGYYVSSTGTINWSPIPTVSLDKSEVFRYYTRGSSGEILFEASSLNDLYRLITIIEYTKKS